MTYFSKDIWFDCEEDGTNGRKSTHSQSLQNHLSNHVLENT